MPIKRHKMGATRSLWGTKLRRSSSCVTISHRLHSGCSFFISCVLYVLFYFCLVVNLVCCFETLFPFFGYFYGLKVCSFFFIWLFLLLLVVYHSMVTLWCLWQSFYIYSLNVQSYPFYDNKGGEINWFINKGLVRKGLQMLKLEFNTMLYWLSYEMGVLFLCISWGGAYGKHDLSNLISIWLWLPIL